ncbi:MAG: hypothetical protein M3N46_05260 [Actinomycetota bacterium]|nr:hypothetical protein [Actinomycetota bacterium]
MSEPTPAQPRSPFNGWYVWAAILLVVIVAAAVIVGISAASGGNKTSASPTKSPKPVAASDSVCGLQPGDQSIPTTAAPQTTWTLVGQVAAPDGPRAIGPGKITSDGLRTCFAQSPVGALYAAATFYALGSDAATAAAGYRYFLPAGAGRDAVLTTLSENPPKGGGGVQIAGFQVRKYERTSAVIDLAVRNSNAAFVSFVTQLVWQDGDWKVVVQDNGQPAVAPAQIDNLSGYLQWSGA